MKKSDHLRIICERDQMAYIKSKWNVEGKAVRDCRHVGFLPYPTSRLPFSNLRTPLSKYTSHAAPFGRRRLAVHSRSRPYQIWASFRDLPSRAAREQL